MVISKENISVFTYPVLVTLLAAVYYYIDFGVEVDTIFLTISTFIYASVSGFFITRQGRRYSELREVIASYDGAVTSVYRTSEHISKKLQKKIGEIIIDEYTGNIKTGKWDYGLDKQSHLITNINNALDGCSGTCVGKVINNPLVIQSISELLNNLSTAQIKRKMMLSLRAESIPLLHWFLLGLLASILVFTIAVIPSAGLFADSVVKSASTVAILAVMSILNRLENLTLSGNVVGQESAEDLIGVVRGSR